MPPASNHRWPYTITSDRMGSVQHGPLRTLRLTPNFAMGVRVDPLISP